MPRPAREIPLRLDAETYERLCRQALEQDRDPWQQARHIIRRALDARREDRPDAAPAVMSWEDAALAYLDRIAAAVERIADHLDQRQGEPPP